MASAGVIFLLLGITLVCGYPVYVTNEADEIENFDENLRRIVRHDNGFQLPQTVDSHNSAISEGRSKFPPTADSVHNLLAEIKKGIPLVPPLKLGLLHKPHGCEKPKPVITGCHHNGHGSSILPGLSLIPGLGHQVYQPLLSPISYSNQGPDEPAQYADPSIQPTLYSGHAPISWESVISEDPKPQTHFTTLPYIHGYKMTPLYSEKQIIVKDYADPYKQGNHAAQYSSIPYPQPQAQQQQQQQQQQNQAAPSARSADLFLPPALQKPYGLDFVMQNDPPATTPEFQQPYGMNSQGYWPDGSALTYA